MALVLVAALCLLGSASGALAALGLALAAAWRAPPGGRWLPAVRSGAGPAGASLALALVAGLLALEREASSNEDVLGVRFVGESEELERHSPPRHFNGDGESWTRRSLPAPVCARLRAEPARLHGRPDFDRSARWETHDWSRDRPESPAFGGALSLLTWARADVAVEVDRAVASGAWIAWGVQEVGSGDRRSAANADLALLDLRRCELILANVNT